MDLRAVTLIAVCVAVTIVLRFLPFVIFGRKKEIPGYITYLSGVLPYAIMGMLVVYCLKNVSFFAGSHEFRRLQLPQWLSGCTYGRGIHCSVLRQELYFICF